MSSILASIPGSFSYKKPQLVLSLASGTYSGSGVWTDSIGNKAFTLYNSPTWSNTNGGQFRFDAASSQWAEIPAGNSLSEMKSFTVQSVFKLHSLPETGYPCVITENWPGNGTKINYALGFINTQTIVEAGFFNSNEGFWNTNVARDTPVLDTWYDVTFSFYGPTKELKTYLNGVLVSSTTTVGTAGTDNAGIRIARRWDDEQYLDCTIKDINIWNGVLTSTEIASQHLQYNSLV